MNREWIFYMRKQHMTKSEYIKSLLTILSPYYQFSENSAKELTVRELEELLETLNAKNDASLCPGQHIA